MKKTKILLGTLVLSAIAVGSLFFGKELKKSAVYTLDEVSFGKNDANSWNQAAEYYRALRANVNTGEIEEADYLEAYNHLQQMEVNKTTAFTFVEEGPDNVGGRTRAIEVHPSNDDVIYAGAVTGGLFVTHNGGNTWERVEGWDASTDLVSISSIAITNDGTIYVATGGGAFENSLSIEISGNQRGNGLWYSTDNGATFTQVQGSNNKDLTKVVADRSKNDVVYVTGSGFGLRKLENKGSFVSFSATGLSTSTATQDVKVSPDGNVILVATSNKIWSSQDGGNNFTLVTGNGAGKISGGSFRNECAISYEKNSAGQWNCYVARVLSNKHIGGVWFSSDNGVTWSRIAQSYVDGSNGGLSWDPTSNQGHYNLVISAVKGHANQCVLGGLNLYKWENTGTLSNPMGTWQAITNWAYPKGSAFYVHADNHRITWNSQGKMIVGNDGGVQMSRTNNITDGFYDTNRGYNVTQFYSIAFGPDGSVLGGAQDNGSNLNNHTGVFSWLEFLAVGGGDGFECEISYLNKDAFITSLYNSGTFRHSDVSDMGSLLDMPAGGPLGQGNGPVGTFYTPLRLFEDAHDDDTQDSIQFIPTHSYSAGDVVHYTSPTFELPLEYTLTQNLVVQFDTTFITSDTITPTYDTLHAGDTLLENPLALDTIMLPDYIQSMYVSHTDLGVFLTRDALRFGIPTEWWKILPVSNNAHSFEFSKDGNWLWIGTMSGTLYRVAGLDSAYSFEQADYSYKDSAQYKLEIDVISGAGSSIVTDISIDKDNPDRVIVTRAGTSNSNVFYSTNATSANPTWTVIDGNGSNGLPNVPVYAAEFIANASTNETVIVGTEYGAFATENINGASTHWTPINSEIGLVPVFEVRQQWRSRDEGVSNPYAVYLGTHGRGIWRSDAVLSTDEITETIDNTPELSNLVVYPNPLTSEGKLGFEINKTSNVTIRMYDLQGKIVNQLSRVNLAKGKHVIPFEVQDLPSGTYIVTVESDEASEVTKFIKY